MRWSIDHSSEALPNRKRSRLPPRTLCTLLLIRIWTGSVHLSSSQTCHRAAPFSGYSPSLFPESVGKVKEHGEENLSSPIQDGRSVEEKVENGRKKPHPLQ